MVWDYIRLARVKQWSKGAFVLIGPIYGRAVTDRNSLLAAVGAFMAFGLASSVCYIHNDVQDCESDKTHPRKRNRPIASGRISRSAAYAFAAILALGAAGCLLLVPSGPGHAWARQLLVLCLGLYVINVLAYSLWLKQKMVADVVSLSMGFVLRVLGGCAALAVEPSSWLLNVTFFLSMFLAFGKRLGERRIMGANVSAARGVQSKYTDDLLRMAVVVTGVATLLTYSEYVLSQAEFYTVGFNLLWITMLPATYCLLRAMVKVETGEYDDPTEMAIKDRPFQLSAAVFGILTVALIALFRLGYRKSLGW